MGKNFHLCHSEEELLSCVDLYDDFYISEFIDKVAEYRVFVIQGKVAWVARKIPHDPSEPVWNIHNGTSVYENVGWGDWPLNVCLAAITAMKHAELDFGGVDVVVQRDTNRPYVLEVNSAPSLPFLSDGSISYRQKCTAKALGYIFDNDDKSWLETTGLVENWRQVIHPAIWSPSG